MGSGFMTHNLRGMLGAGPGRKGASPDPRYKAFADWVHETLTSPALAAAERGRRLAAIVKEAPHFREAHPREEHLIPLMVAVGAAHPECVPGAAASAAAAAAPAGAAAAAGAAGGAGAGDAAASGASDVFAHRVFDSWVLGVGSFASYVFPGSASSASATA